VLPIEGNAEGLHRPTTQVRFRENVVHKNVIRWKLETRNCNRIGDADLIKVKPAEHRPRLPCGPRFPNQMKLRQETAWNGETHLGT